jgi:DNA-binding MarR family transcriptional regulator
MGRTHRWYATHLLRELDLFPGQELLIMLLSERGAQAQNELVQILGLDHSTVAKALRRMEAAGLIKRRQSSADRRATVVALAPKGVAMVKKINAVWAKLEQAATAALTAEQQTIMVGLMQTIADSVAAHHHEFNAKGKQRTQQ